MAVGSRFQAVAALPSSFDAAFIVVPTPSKQNGSFDISFVLDATRAIGERIDDSEGYKLVVVVSTVMPGQMELVRATLIDETSLADYENRIGLCYNPEFVALGSVLANLEHPDFVLIGESDEEAGRLLEIILDQYKGDDRIPVFHTNFINAELAKLAINSYVTMKITFACMMARLAEKLPGADVDVVSNILGADSRIGRKYLTGGDGFGGPCFPRDNQALAQLAYSLGASARLPRTVVQENEELIWVINSKICEVLKDSKRLDVLILGMAYKPGTSVTEQSQGMALLNAPQRSEFGEIHYTWYDPMVAGPLHREDVPSMIEGVGVVVIMQMCPEFRDFDYGDTPVIDLWRFLRNNPPEKWMPMGIGATNA